MTKVTQETVEKRVARAVRMDKRLEAGRGLFEVAL